MDSLIDILKIKAQIDWTNRAAEIHDAETIAGIQIGYNRAISALTEGAGERARAGFDRPVGGSNPPPSLATE